MEGIGVDIGGGMVIRLDQAENRVIGLTVLSLRSRLLESRGDIQ